MLCHCITAANRARYSAQLDQMHRQRHEVFVDRLGWRELRRPDQRDVDEYDTEESVYLVVIDETGEVHAHGRMNPTWGRHQLEPGSTLRRRFSTETPLSGPRIWEGSRLVGGFPDRHGRDFARQTLFMVLVALQEFAVRRGIVEAISILELPALARFQAMGWRTTPLGIPTRYETDHGPGEAIAAIWHTGAQCLASARKATKISHPILYEAPPLLEDETAPDIDFQLLDVAAGLQTEEARTKALTAIHELRRAEIVEPLRSAMN